MRAVFSSIKFNRFCNKLPSNFYKLTKRYSAVYSNYSFPIKLSQEVEYAKANKIPIVALESTIVSHGMPYPRNMVRFMIKY